MGGGPVPTGNGAATALRASEPAIDVDAAFRAARLVALTRINLSTFWFGAALVMLFSWWDWYVDPAHWAQAFAIRCAGSVLILSSGIIQRVSGRVDWAAGLARLRYGAGVITVAAALAVLDRGYWFARSSGFVEVSAFHWLTWLRGVGATLFILGGVLPIAWMVLQGAGRLKPGKSRANEPVLEDRPVGHDPHGSKVVMDPSM